MKDDATDVPPATDAAGAEDAPGSPSVHFSSLLIADDDALAAACKRWSVIGVIGVDTEFVRERTYYPRPGLIQLSDGETVAMVDPLEISDFGPLAGLLIDPAVTKLMHAYDEDLDVLEPLLGVAPLKIFDTQLAGAFVGYGFSSSYADLVSGVLGVVLDKGLTRSDWIKRPLSAAQLHYAALDAVYLPRMYERLSRELAVLGRRTWLEEEVEHRRRASVVGKQPEAAYLKVRGRGALAPAQHGILRALCHWREVEAMARDIPRRHLLTDEVLLRLASEPALDAASLENVEALSRRARTRYGQVILRCIDAARTQGPDDADRPVSLRPYAGLLTSLKEIVRIEAARLRISPALLASRRALEALLVSVLKNGRDIPTEFQGWRFTVVTSALLDYIHRMK